MLADQIAMATSSIKSSHKKVGVEKDKKEGLEWLKRHSLSENERDDA